jgi:hypothetical protein
VTTAELTRPDVRNVPRFCGALAGDIPPRLPFLRRTVKHPGGQAVNRLVVLVMTANLGWVAYAAALTAQTNLAAAMVFRQPYILNALAWLVTRPPTSWPLRLRWALGKYYHFGGLHVGTGSPSPRRFAQVRPANSRLSVRVTNVSRPERSRRCFSLSW